jgi:hypothetical protein
VGALQEGTATPAELAEIYRLSASTATVLGDRESAELYYRRWLALEPDATLPASVAPKLREPFVPAQAYMAAHGRLSVRALRRAGIVTVVLETDPLTMAASAAVDGAAPVAFDAERRARLPAPSTARHVVVRDVRGNTLVELALPAAVADAVVAPPRETSPSPSLVRRPALWGILTVAAGATAIGFGLGARAADDDLATILAHSGEHTFADAMAARDRRDRRAFVANAGFIATGVFAVTTAIMFVTRPERTVVVPQASSSSVGLALARSW